MIVHKTVSVKLDVFFFAGIYHAFEKSFVVTISLEDDLSAVTSCNNVLKLGLVFFQ